MQYKSPKKTSPTLRRSSQLRQNRSPRTDRRVVASYMHHAGADEIHTKAKYAAMHAENKVKADEARRVYAADTNEGHGLLTTPDLSEEEQHELERKVFYLVSHSACAFCTHLCTQDMHKGRFDDIQALFLNRISLHQDKRSFFEIIKETYRANQNAEKARVDRVAELDARRNADRSTVNRY
jgi:hypothetical protein